MIMNRVAPVLLGLALSSLAVGCADEGTKEDCVGLKCPGGFQWPEGGEVRIWTIRLPDGSLLTSYFAFFIESQSPDVPLPEPAVGICDIDLTGAQGENRQYIDVGESVSFELATGDTVEVPRMMADPEVDECMPGTACKDGVMDFYGRMHDIAYLMQTFEEAGPRDDFYNHFHSVTTADEMPFSDQLDNLWLGPSFDVTRPQRDDDAVVTLHRGEDITFEWTNEQNPDPTVASAAAIVFVPDVCDNPPCEISCLTLNDGDFTVGGDVITDLSADSGIMLVGNGSDDAVLHDGRIIHKWGQFCNLFPWARVD